MRLKKLLGTLHLATGFRSSSSIWRVVDRYWFRTVYVFFVLDYGTREVVRASVPEHPELVLFAQQLRGFCGFSRRYSNNPAKRTMPVSRPLEKAKAAVLLLCLGIAFSLGNMAVAESWPAIEIAGRQVEPGNKRKFPYLQSDSFEATYLNSPIFVARGSRSGYSLCVTAGIHGDELNGMEIARRAFAAVDPNELSGTLIVFPSVNAEGARTGRRDMIDRRDLNRSFPGSATGSIASIVADRLFHLIRTHCHALVDLHTGSNARFNLPQIRVTPDDHRAVNIARHFGVGIIVLDEGPEGSLRREISKAGLPSINYEGGASGEFQEKEIQQGVRGVISVLRYLDMLPSGEMLEVPTSKIYAETHWTRAPAGGGGYFFPTCVLGGPVVEGQELGYIVDPLTDKRTIIESPYNGQIIGFATPQIVLPGFGLFHIGLQTPDSDPKP